MNSKINFIKENFLVIIILVVISFYRLPLIWESYPIFKNLDEPYLINSGLRVLNNLYLKKSLDPEFYHWGSFPIYVSALLNSLVILYNFIFLNPNSLSLESLSYSIERIDFHIVNRLFSFILMNFSVLIFYYFCKKNFNNFIAISSSLILLISPGYSHLSTTATIDHWNVLFSVLIIYYSFEIYKNFSITKNLVIYGIILGVSVATKYFNFLYVVPFLTIYFSKIKKNKLYLKKLTILFAISLTCFALAMPYVFINFTDFINSLIVLYEYNHTRIIEPDTQFNNSYIKLFKYLFSMSFINSFVLAFSLISMIYLIQKNKSKYFILITYPIIFLTFIGYFSVFFSRNLIPILPFVAILASICIHDLYNLVKKKNYKYYFLIILLVLSSPSLVINYNKIKNSFLEDTRFTSLKWIQENLSPNEKILAGHYSPPIWHLKNFKDAKKVWFEQDFEKEKNYRIIDSTVKYIILSSSAYSRYFNSDGTLKDSSKKQGLLYLNFFEKNKLMKEFKPDYKKTTGPVIRIYINNIYKE